MRTLPNKKIFSEALELLHRALRTAHTKQILVIGDVMLDEFVYGSTERMSPEAPVPILRERSRKTYLGGAGNTACNLAKLGVKTTLIGVVGNDTASTTIRNLTKDAGITSILVTEKDFPTTVKTRLVGPQGHMLRVDNEALLPISKKSEDAVIAHIQKLPHQDAVIVSDYAKGVMTKRVVTALIERFGSESISADIKPKQIQNYTTIGLVKANVHEAFEIVGLKATSHESAERVLALLRKKVRGSIVMTRGGKGMSIFEEKRDNVHHIPAVRTHVKDVTGAGDTTLATLALMRAGGTSLTHAAHAASFVASKAVAEEGTTSLTQKQLQ